MTSFTDNAIACGISIAGKAHQNSKNSNQDCCIVKRSSIGTALCVCDGVGSEKFSSYGSRAACKAVLKVFRLYYRKRISKELLGPAIEKYYRQYVRKTCRNAAGTTCLFCFIYKNAEVLVGQAGDGIIIIREDSKLIVFQDRYKSFVNEVYPLQCKRRYNAWNIKNVRFSPELNDSLDILFASDGVSDDVIPEKREVFLNHFISISRTGGNAEIKSVLENWNVPGSVDDKSVVIFSWRK